MYGDRSRVVGLVLQVKKTKQQRTPNNAETRNILVVGVIKPSSTRKNVNAMKH